MPSRRALARLAHGVFKALVERRLARQQRNSLHFHATVRAFHPIHLDVYRGPELTPRQVPYRPFIAVIGIGEPAATAGAFQLPVAALPPNPQLQELVLLVDSLPVNTVAGPLKDSGELVIGRQPLSLTGDSPFLGMAVNPQDSRIPAQSQMQHAKRSHR